MTLPLTLLMALAAAALLAGCGSSDDGGSTHPDYAKALKGAPAPLAAIYGESDELLPGGADAFGRRVESLGYPVVANVWASWCGPCRLEFPIFQEVSARMGKRVAFLGVDTEDSEAHASAFLANNAVPYPSYYDPGYEVKTSLKLVGLPGTAFYDSDGTLAYTKVGPYSDAAELEADIERYLLKGA